MRCFQRRCCWSWQIQTLEWSVLRQRARVKELVHLHQMARAMVPQQVQVRLQRETEKGCWPEWSQRPASVQLRY